MKLVVFAHTPPPHHGQSYMVQLLLDGLASDRRFEIFHVNARVSDDLGDVGGIRPGKILRLLRYCAEAIWHRVRHEADTLYYVPAPAKRSAIIRDWIVMLLMRPFFSRVVLHWHAFGLGLWANGLGEQPTGKCGPILPAPVLFGGGEKAARWLTRKLLGGADLSLVLTEYNRRDAEALCPQRVAVVPNGLPDPCPDFDTAILPARLARRAKPPFRVLFLAHCTREKGLFDAMSAIALAHRAHPQIQLTVAGGFMDEAERAEFDRLLAALPEVTYAGFVSGVEKDRLFRESDCLLFPTCYPGETFGLVALEALLYGLPVVTTRWRGLPEILPTDWPWIAAIHDPEALALHLATGRDFADFASLRRWALDRFGLDQFTAGFAAAVTDGAV